MSDTIRLCVQTHHPIDPGNYEGPIHCTACPEGTPCVTALYVRREEVNDLRDQVQMYEEKAERDWRDFGEMQDARIAADDRVVELEKELARVCKQLDSANDMVERAWSLIAAAMSGSPRQFTDEWKDAAQRWEVDYCMGQGASGLRSRSSVGGGGVVSAVDADAPHQREPGEALDTPGTTAARIVEENPYRSYDQIAADTRTAEIVEMLRAEFQRFSEDSMATDEDLARRDGWLDAADLIESRFAAKEEDDGE